MLPQSTLFSSDNAPYTFLEERGKEVVDITDDLPFEIPDSWEWIRWGALSHSIQYGFNAPASEKGNARMVRISDIQNGEVLWDTVPFCNINNPDIPTYELKKNDILFARTGGTVGKSFLVSDIPYTNVIYAGYLIRTRCSSLLNPNYLKMFMESKLYWDQLRDGTTATAQPNCNGQTLGKMLIPIPPISEQNRIIKYLNEIQPLIDEYSIKEKISNSIQRAFPDQLKKSILQEAIQGKLVPQDPNDEPASVLLERIRTEKEELIKQGKIKKDKNESIIYRRDNSYYEKQNNSEINIDEEIPFDIPDNWGWVRFKDLVKYHIGKTPERNQSFYWGDGLAWVSISDMKELGLVNATKESITYLALSDVFKGNISKAGTLLMSFKLTVGRTAILGIDAVHNEAIISIKPFVDCDNKLRDYLFFTLPLLTEYGSTKDAIKGKTLNTKSIDSLLIPLPPLNEQKRIIRKIKKLYLLSSTL